MSCRSQGKVNRHHDSFFFVISSFGCDVIDFLEFRDFIYPDFLHEADVVWVIVIAIIVGLCGKFHREAKCIGVFGADFL